MGFGRVGARAAIPICFLLLLFALLSPSAPSTPLASPCLTAQGASHSAPAPAAASQPVLAAPLSAPASASAPAAAAASTAAPTAQPPATSAASAPGTAGASSNGTAAASTAAVPQQAASADVAYVLQTAAMYPWTGTQPFYSLCCDMVSVGEVWEKCGVQCCRQLRCTRGRGCSRSPCHAATSWVWARCGRGVRGRSPSPSSRCAATWWVWERDSCTKHLAKAHALFAPLLV